MPLLWECVIGFVLEPVIAAWERDRKGIGVERCAIASSLSDDGPIPPPFLCAADCSDRLAHSTWVDDIDLVSEGLRELQGMAEDLRRAAAAEGLRIATGKLHLWSARPNKICVAGIFLDAEDDLTVLGLSVACGGRLSRAQDRSCMGRLPGKPLDSPLVP